LHSATSVMCWPACNLLACNLLATPSSCIFTAVLKCMLRATRCAGSPYQSHCGHDRLTTPPHAKYKSVRTPNPTPQKIDNEAKRRIMGKLPGNIATNGATDDESPEEKQLMAGDSPHPILFLVRVFEPTFRPLSRQRGFGRVQVELSRIGASARCGLVSAFITCVCVCVCVWGGGYSAKGTNTPLFLFPKKDYDG
jgi:hypothetical protein